MTKKRSDKKRERNFDPEEETRLDWECATRFNKLIWSKWPKSVESVRGLCEWLRKKGYVARWRMPYAGNCATVKKTLLDLYVAEHETICELFKPYDKLPDDEEIRSQMISEYRMAQRSGLVCTSYIDEFNGGAMGFALFRDPGTSNCLVYVVYQ